MNRKSEVVVVTGALVTWRQEVDEHHSRICLAVPPSRIFVGIVVAVVVGEEAL